RPRERAHPRFVDARHAQDPALPQLRLEAQELAQALPLRAVLSPPLEDRVEELLGARPRIVAQDRLDLAGERTAFVDVACLELREGESVAHVARITDSGELRPVESVLVPHAARSSRLTGRPR